MTLKQYINQIQPDILKLSDVNQRNFNIVLAKTSAAHIDLSDAIEFIRHCLEMFINAEQNNEPVEEYLGTYDIELFCNNSINDIRTKYSFAHRLYFEIRYVPAILLIYLGLFEMFIKYFMYVRDFGYTTSVQLDTSMFIDTILILTIVSSYNILINSISKKLYGKNNYFKRKNAIICIFICIIIALISLTKTYMSQYMFDINYFVYLAIMAIVCIFQSFFESR